MRHIIWDEWYFYAEKFWLVNSAKSGLRTDILRAILGQLEAMLARHRKIFVFRFDLHQNYSTSDNKRITVFNRKLFKRIKRHYQSRVAFAWVREQEKAKQQHYHFVLILDGSKVNHPHQLQLWITEIWCYCGSCHWAGYHNINRSNEKERQIASRHISYLAKPRGKGYRPIQTKDYGTSRLKHLSIEPVKTINVVTT